MNKGSKVVCKKLSQSFLFRLRFLLVPVVCIRVFLHYVVLAEPGRK